MPYYHPDEWVSDDIEADQAADLDWERRMAPWQNY